MSHRVVIINKLKEVFTDPVVREEMTSNQCAKVQNILTNEEPNPENFRELTHCLNRVYSKED